MKPTAILATLLLAPLPVAASAQQAFTLEQVMSAPFPEELVAAPTGGGVAWTFNDRGARNIWVAAPPDYRARAVTAYTEDDGQEIADLHWTPDAKTIVYVRGGGKNRSGEYPNPRSFTADVAQELWVVAVAGGTPRRIAEGHSPAISPKGDHVAFVASRQIWSASLTDSGAATQLLHARGAASALRWSPDGSQLAFVSDRGDHAFIAVYDLATKAVRFLDPSTDTDGEPAWSPDGKRIAFLRIPADVGTLPFTPARSAQPWSIRVADVASGAVHAAWVADTGTGSAFREIVADNQISWATGDRLVFPWEKDGWTHLYSVPAAGGVRAALLTPGAFEVEYVAPTGDGTAIYYNSNQDDIDRRHLWRVGAAGGAPVAITKGTQLEWAPSPTSDGKIAFLHADTRQPPRPAVMAVGGAPKDLTTPPAGFPAAALVDPQPVIFSSTDGLQIHGQLFLPAGAKAGDRRPAVIFFHGGSRRQMLLGWHYMYYYRNAYALNQYLASKGYVVLSVNYRSGIGYGLEFREALHYGAHGASEVQDVMAAGLYLRSRNDVDPQRIGLWGGSYGGFLTAMGLAKASDLFAAGVDLHGVHDWNIEIQNWVEYDPAKNTEFARLAHESSPIAYVDDWRSPVLLIHGDDDRNVQFSQTVQLAAALRARHVDVEQLIFPDEIHDFLLYGHWMQAYSAAADFLDRKLRTGNRR